MRATSGMAAAGTAGRYTHTEKAVRITLQISGGNRIFGLLRLSLFDSLANGGKAVASGL